MTLGIVNSSSLERDLVSTNPGQLQRYAFGRLGKDVARGLTVRTDWGPQYTAHAFGAELRWLGIQHSPSFVGEPQCNGVIERFMRTLKEQCLWLHRFTDLA
jgi:transposase InsO family protein